MGLSGPRQALMGPSFGIFAPFSTGRNPRINPMQSDPCDQPFLARALASRISPEILRRPAMASAV